MDRTKIRKMWKMAQSISALVKPSITQQTVRPRRENILYAIAVSRQIKDRADKFLKQYMAGDVNAVGLYGDTLSTISNFDGSGAAREIRDMTGGQTDYTTNGDSHHIMKELILLDEKYDNVCISGGYLMATQREPVALTFTSAEGRLISQGFGRFQIKAHLRPPGAFKFLCTPLDPVFHHQSRYYHPHINREGRVCMGGGAAPSTGESLNATMAFKLAKAGLYSQLIDLCDGIIREYNNGSPYAYLGDWTGIPCSFCGEHGNNTFKCTSSKCSERGKMKCKRCKAHCSTCGSSQCSSCVRRSADGQPICYTCASSYLCGCCGKIASMSLMSRGKRYRCKVSSMIGCHHCFNNRTKLVPEGQQQLKRRRRRRQKQRTAHVQTQTQALVQDADGQGQGQAPSGTDRRTRQVVTPTLAVDQLPSTESDGVPWGV